MATKYQGLPDIDTAPDVFETADEPELPLRPNNDHAGEDESPKKQRADAEGIDGRGLPDRRRAERAFGRVRRKDGSYQLGLPPLTRTLSSSSSDERAIRPREAPAARIRRLKAELAEMEQQLADGVENGVAGDDRTARQRSTTGEVPETGVIAGPSTKRTIPKRKSVIPAREPMDVMAEMAQLQARMAKLDEVGSREAVGRFATEDGWKKRLDHLGDEAAANGVEEGEPLRHEQAPIPGDMGETGLGDLDRRLAELEGLIGTAGEGVEQPTTSLLPTLQKHEHLLNLLTQPRQLDAISRRIKLLLVDLDRAAAASRRAGVSVTSGHSLPSGSGAGQSPSDTITLSASEYSSLQSLFSLLPRLDALLPIIPPLLNRLASLSALHSGAADMAERVERMEKEDKRQKEEGEDIAELLKGVKEGLNGGTELVKGNWEGVEARMRGLEERLSRL